MATVRQQLGAWLAVSFWALPLIEVSLAAAAAPPAAKSGAESAAVDYVGQIKPILTRHCVACHGAVKPRGALRLDTAAAALKGGKNGPAVVVGNGDESPLVTAVRGDGPSERMPLNRPALADAEIKLLEAWIDQGARANPDEQPGLPPRQSHWAFVAPTRPAVPQVASPRWPRNPIDRFILARLEHASLHPSAEADRATLLRRVSLDVVGLPPSPEEIDAFLADRSESAYERAVDRLLASPHFGERWARPWLDQARYADSNGYNIDAPRSIWKYRDWVIGAFNADMPFDQFTIDQIAGDLSPHASLPQRIATGFIVTRRSTRKAGSMSSSSGSTRSSTGSIPPGRSSSA